MAEGAEQPALGGAPALARAAFYASPAPRTHTRTHKFSTGSNPLLHGHTETSGRILLPLGQVHILDRLGSLAQIRSFVNCAEKTVRGVRAMHAWCRCVRLPLCACAWFLFVGVCACACAFVWSVHGRWAAAVSCRWLGRLRLDGELQHARCNMPDGIQHTTWPAAGGRVRLRPDSDHSCGPQAAHIARRRAPHVLVRAPVAL